MNPQNDDSASVNGVEKQSTTKLSRAVGFVFGVFIGLILWSVVVSAIFFEKTGASIWTMAKVIAVINDSYVESLSADELREKMVSGLVENLDPHSSWTSQEKTDAFIRELGDGAYGGIGITAKFTQGKIMVREMHPNAPAKKAGISVGDRIVEIDGTGFSEKNMSDAFGMLRGPDGSSVRVVVEKSDGSRSSLDVPRTAIDVPSAQWGSVKTADGSLVAFLRIRKFNEKTVAEISDAFDAKFSMKTTPRALIIDLRDNPGGHLPVAVGVSSLFLKPDAPVVTIKNSRGDIERKWTSVSSESSNGRSLGEMNSMIMDMARKNPEYKKIPIAILVNRGSASASELVAAAMKDNGRAVIIGNRTFGKGSVQTVFDLGGGDGTLKLTTSRYFTPSGKSIQAVGVVPDIGIEDQDDHGAREEDIPGHLGNDPAKPASKAKDLKALAARLSSSEPDEKRRRAEDKRDNPFPVFTKRLSIPEPDAYISAAIKALAS